MNKKEDKYLSIRVKEFTDQAIKDYLISIIESLISNNSKIPTFLTETNERLSSGPSVYLTMSYFKEDSYGPGPYENADFVLLYDDKRNPYWDYKGYNHSDVKGKLASFYN